MRGSVFIVVAEEECGTPAVAATAAESPASSLEEAETVSEPLEVTETALEFSVCSGMTTELVSDSLSALAQPWRSSLNALFGCSFCLPDFLVTVFVLLFYSI